MKDFHPTVRQLHKYLHGALNPQNTEFVERWLAENPDELESLELDLLMKQGLSLMQNETESIQSPIKRSIYFNVALICIGMVLGTIFPMSYLNNTKLISAPDTLMLMNTRSEDTSFFIVQHDVETILQIPVSYLSRDKYSIKIFGSDDFTREIHSLLPQDDIITLSIPKNHLDVGKYKLEIKNNTNQNSIVYKFLVN